MPLPHSTFRPLLAGLFGLAMVAGASPARATVMKCTGPDGQLTYTDRTCPKSTEKRQLIRTTSEGGEEKLAGGATAVRSVSGPTGASVVSSGPIDNGGSPPPPTIVGGSGSTPNTGPSVSGANSDVRQTAVGTGSTAPNSITAPARVTP